MLTVISQRKFLHNLKKRKLEKLDVVRSIEKVLMQQRHYIFRMPRPGTPVILLLSGGLDSVTCWAILMKEFGLNVYPLSFDRGEKRANRELESIKFFSKYYAKRFPKLYHEPKRLAFGLGDIKIPIEHATAQLHPKIIMENFKGKSWLSKINLSFGSFLLLPIYAKLYAEYLYHTKFLHIRNIFCSVTLSDGLIVPHQTFTSLRAIMFQLCAATGDYSWQFTSTVFEKETGLCFDKSDLVSWAVRHDIPLEKSWSCYHATKYQCGGSDCVTCIARRRAFEQAGVMDKTIYLSVESQTLRSRFGRMLNKVKGKVQSVLEIR